MCVITLIANYTHPDPPRLWIRISNPLEPFSRCRTEIDPGQSKWRDNHRMAPHRKTTKHPIHVSARQLLLLLSCLSCLWCVVRRGSFHLRLKKLSMSPPTTSNQPPRNFVAGIVQSSDITRMPPPKTVGRAVPPAQEKQVQDTVVAMTRWRFVSVSPPFHSHPYHNHPQGSSFPGSQPVSLDSRSLQGN